VNDDAAASPPNLEPDGITAALAGACCGIPEGYVSFKGYLGCADECEMHRIYLDNSFWKWLEVHADDIKHREDVPPNEKDPRSVFWVKRCAKVITCKVDLAHEIEDVVWNAADDPAAYGRPPY
jgi:hypothetical protein